MYGDTKTKHDRLNRPKQMAGGVQVAVAIIVLLILLTLAGTADMEAMRAGL